jgi:LysM repeat protein
MSLTIDQFVANHNNRLINNGGVQCVAVANQYELEVVEGGWIGTPLTGWATDWWTNFGNDSDYDNYIRVDASEQPQKGDLAIWKKYNNNSLPHIALVLENQGSNVKCFTQNPGNARIESLTKNGIIGYLRPKKFIRVAPAPVVQAPTAVATEAGQREHIVQPGETLSGIGAAYGVDYNDIARLSGIADPDHIEAGWKLVIPAGLAPAAAPSRIVHHVLPGEYLGLIAQNYGVSVQQIVDLNGIANPDYIQAGWDLVIQA